MAPFPEGLAITPGTVSTRGGGKDGEGEAGTAFMRNGPQRGCQCHPTLLPWMGGHQHVAAQEEGLQAQAARSPAEGPSRGSAHTPQLLGDPLFHFSHGSLGFQT